MIKKSVLIVVLVIVTSSLFACSMFTATKNGKTLTGNNEDYINPNTRMWTVHGAAGEFGRIYFGFDNMFPQGGMNEMGLVFDGFTTPYKKIVAKDKIPYEGSLIDLIMSKCATIEDVVKIFDKYHVPLEEAQLMFVDKSGNSVIIEGDDYVFISGDYQVATNFYMSEITNKDEITCERYKLATSLLDTCEVTVDNFRKILATVHNEWAGGGTLYSNIYDADNLTVYLYFHHNYENVVIIDLMKELADEEHITELYSLFPPSFCAMKFAEQGNSEMKFEEEMNGIWKEEGITSLLKNYQKGYDGHNKMQPLINEYKEIVKDYGVTSDTKIHDRILNRIGYKLLNDEKYEDAIRVFEYNVKLYPKEWNVYDSLAEAYLKSGDKKNALKFYKLSVRHNSDNPEVKKIIEDLKKG